MAGGGHNEAKFKAEILALSVSNDWDIAKAEWHLDFVYMDPADRACECEHSPIHQICVIKNDASGKSTEVGNVCVRRFLRLLSNRVFSVLKRVKADTSKSLNPEALRIFRNKGVISDSEKQDYERYWRRRTNLSDDQKAQKDDINRRVLDYFEKETLKLVSRAAASGIEKIKAQRLPV